MHCPKYPGRNQNASPHLAIFLFELRRGHASLRPGSLRRASGLGGGGDRAGFWRVRGQQAAAGPTGGGASFAWGEERRGVSRRWRGARARSGREASRWRRAEEQTRRRWAEEQTKRRYRCPLIRINWHRFRSFIFPLPSSSR